MGRPELRILVLMLLLPLGMTARAAVGGPGVETVPHAAQSAGGETEEKPGESGEEEEEEEEPSCD